MIAIEPTSGKFCQMRPRPVTSFSIMIDPDFEDKDRTRDGPLLEDIVGKWLTKNDIVMSCQLVTILLTTRTIVTGFIDKMRTWHCAYLLDGYVYDEIPNLPELTERSQQAIFELAALVNNSLTATVVLKIGDRVWKF